MAVFLSTSFALHAASKEGAFKAESLYNFTKFTVWPDKALRESSFNLCVFSQNKPHDGLQALSGKLVTGKPLMLLHNVSHRNVNHCQMLFIANDGNLSVHKILNKIKKLPILTVSDHPDFINDGGMIGLIQDGQHVSFEINVEASNNVGIHFGAQLLKLAKRTKGVNTLI